MLCHYRKPYFRVYDEKLTLITAIDNVITTNLSDLSSKNLPTNYLSITSNQKDRVYLTTNNSIIMTDLRMNFIKLLKDYDTYKYLSNSAYSSAYHLLYVCDCLNKTIHIFDNNLNSIQKHKFNFEPLKIEILNETICIMPQYDAMELNSLHLYDLNTFNFIFNFQFNHYGPIGTIGSSYFCLYDYTNATIHLIQQNGYFNDSVQIEIDRKKFHLCDKILDINGKLFITSSINEKAFFLSNDLF